MSTTVIALRSNQGEKYQKHLKVLIACREAEIRLPEETAKFFGCNDPYEGLEDEILEVEIPVAEYKTEMSEGYEIKLSDLPDEVEKIRFINSW